ncbi:uncharacterized protein LOC135696714 [Rhopilema esculentum]|uniref:uncharacterized protein LOC135696714 n=1 Tax=Rhopilema esculentum TaxID=499914 RepID=UPI0031D61FC7
MANQVALVIFAISSVYSFHLPPVNIGVPQNGNGTCSAFNGEQIKVGEWKPVDNCKLNCTCVQVEKNQFLECSPWCKQQRKVCKLGEKLEEEKYFEEVGKTGCKRCVSIVCDALQFPPPHNSENIKPMKKICTEPHTDGPYKVLEEVEEILVNPHPNELP